MFSYLEPENKGMITKKEIAQWWLVERKEEDWRRPSRIGSDTEHTGKIATSKFVEQLETLNAGITTADLVSIDAREFESKREDEEGYITFESFANNKK